MNIQRQLFAGACLALVAVTLAINSSPAWGQRTRSTAERRQHPGRGFWANERASRNLRHARDYSQSLYHYSRDAASVEPGVAKAESEQLGKNIESTKKELAAVRKDANGNQETLAALDVIEKHLAKAAELHKTLHAECCKDAVDGGVCAGCCSEITKELEKALAEHGALMRKLELKSPSEADQAPKKRE